MTMSPSIRRTEILVQATVIDRIATATGQRDLEIIATYAPEWRQTINEVEREKGRVPTPDEIIWITGVNHRRNPLMR